MTKILLVEDDNNLREIFEMRLQADGYQTVTASNGEEGIAVAMQEKPDLIVADVMMPKLSGFDMLQQLRTAPELKDTKVIMMTALGQAEDQQRGEQLGVLKYLVKSQATLEDFAKVIKDVMPPDGAQATPGNDNQQANGQNINQQESEKKMDDQTNPMPTNDPSAPAAPAADASAPTNPVAGDTSMPSAPADNGQMTTAQEQTEVQDQMNSFASSMPDPAAPAAPAADPSAPAAPAADASAPAADPAAPAAGSAPTDQNNQTV